MESSTPSSGSQAAGLRGLRGLGLGLAAAGAGLGLLVLRGPGGAPVLSPARAEPGAPVTPTPPGTGLAAGVAAGVPTAAPQPAKAVPGLPADRVPLLAPRWERGLRLPGAPRRPGALWEADEMERYWEPLAALPDAVVGMAEDRLERVSLADGKVTAAGPAGTARYAQGLALGGRVLLREVGAAVQALDGRTLAPLWRTVLAEPATDALLPVGTGYVLAVSAQKSFGAPYALQLLEAGTGRAVWRAALGAEYGRCTFHADAARVFSDCMDRQTRVDRVTLRALDARSGAELWRREFPYAADELTSSDAWLVRAGRVDRTLLVMAAATGATVRSEVVLGENYEAPRLGLRGDTVYFFDADSRLAALDVRDAPGRFRFRVGRYDSSSTTLRLSEALYVFGADGTVAVRGLGDGALLWDWSLGMAASGLGLPTAPEAGGAPLLVRSHDTLSAFSPGARPVPAERAVFTGRIFNLTDLYKVQEYKLRVGGVAATVDKDGRYRAVVTARGRLALSAAYSDGFMRRHGQGDECAYGEGGAQCPVLVPLSGKGRYVVDLDLKGVPHDCH